MVADPVEVREGDLRAHRRHQHEGIELQVVLRHAVGTGQPGRAALGVGQEDDGVGHRLARGRADADHEVSRPGQARDRQGEHKRQESAHGVHRRGIW